MSARTAAQHSPAELIFATMDLDGEIAYFQSESASEPGKLNVTAYDTTDGAAYCFCRASECNKHCWHVAHVAAAWRLVAHTVRCQRMTMAELVVHGESLVKHILQADAAGQVWIAGNLRQQLDEARVVWQEKRAAERAVQPAAAPLVALAPAALSLAA